MGGLLSSLAAQEVVAFTGSGEAAARLRSHETLSANNVHLNVEADSLNAAALGPDVAIGSEALNLFLADVVKEETQNAGQKCTAIRRIYAPRERLDEIREMLVERFSDIRVGDPATEKTTLGPLARPEQLKGGRSAIDRLGAQPQVTTRGAKL